MLETARADADLAKIRQCEAKAYMVMLADAQGDGARARSLSAERAAECRPGTR